jgi:large subunit ribosomal protein L31
VRGDWVCHDFGCEVVSSCNAQVFCNGEEVMTTSGTQPKYTVDIWSGNHPFFKGSSSTVVVDEGRVNRFKRRYAGLDTMADMSTMKQGAWCPV